MTLDSARTRLKSIDDKTFHKIDTVGWIKRLPL